jgi:hypothetical protein
MPANVPYFLTSKRMAFDQFSRTEEAIRIT